MSNPFDEAVSPRTATGTRFREVETRTPCVTRAPQCSTFIRTIPNTRVHGFVHMTSSVISTNGGHDAPGQSVGRAHIARPREAHRPAGRAPVGDERRIGQR